MLFCSGDRVQTLKGEQGIMHKRFQSLNKEVEDHKESARRLQGELSGLNNVIKNQEKDLVTLKKTITERDDIIQEKVPIRLPYKEFVLNKLMEIICLLQVQALRYGFYSCG